MASDLIERLRRGDWNPECGQYMPCDDRDEAAATIAALQKRVEEVEAELAKVQGEYDRMGDLGF